MVKSYTNRDPVELKLARRWRKEKMSMPAIAKLLGRSKETVSKWLKLSAKETRATAGRPKAVTPVVYAELKRTLTALQKAAGGQKEVTVAMVKAKARSPLSIRTIRDAFHAHGVRFHKLREKPILTIADRAARRVFARKYVGKSKAQWASKPHAIIDNKHFPMYLDKAAREHAARRSVRGAYRDGGSAVRPDLVKPKGTIKYPVKSVQVTAAVVKGRLRMWKYCEGRWNSRAAAAMYSGPLVRTLRKAFPDIARQGRSKWLVLEDNDPAGYKSRAALAAKTQSKIDTMNLPPRSPDLNVLDYSIWHEINVRMRKQEAAFDPDKKETVDEYLKRLRHTAVSLPTAIVTRAVGDMKRRVALVQKSRGGLINE